MLWSGPCEPHLDDKRLCSLWSAGSPGTSLPSSSWPLLSRSCQGLHVVPCLFFCWDQHLSAGNRGRLFQMLNALPRYSLTSPGQGCSRRDGKNEDSKAWLLSSRWQSFHWSSFDKYWMSTYCVLGTMVGVDFKVSSLLKCETIHFVLSPPTVCLLICIYRIVSCCCPFLPTCEYQVQYSQIISSFVDPQISSWVV